MRILPTHCQLTTLFCRLLCCCNHQPRYDNRMCDEEALVLKVCEAVQVLTAQDLIFDVVKTMWASPWAPKAALARCAAVSKRYAAMA